MFGIGGGVRHFTLRLTGKKQTGQHPLAPEADVALVLPPELVDVVVAAGLRWPRVLRVPLLFPTWS